MLTYGTISNQNYDDLLFQVIKNTEGTETRPYIDAKGIPTIGIGFNLREASIREEVLEKFGFDLTASSGSAEKQYIQQIENAVNGSYSSNLALQQALNGIMNARYQDTRIPAENRTRNAFEFANDAEMEPSFWLLVPTYETKVDTQLLSDIPLSRERVALVSLAWNTRDGSTTLLGPALLNALQNDNRAEAWYEIRYNSNREQLPGIAKRRFYEADIFSLYNGQSPTEAEAIQVYQMYTAHRNRILTYEETYGYINGRNGSRGNWVAVANGDFNAEVGTLQEELQPAADVLLGIHIKDEYRDMAGFDPSFNPLNIQVASD
jgi:GH24 family phage-related lysozyme (muramidase)